MLSGKFEDLYIYKEKKHKGNLENYFTELINLMCNISFKFKKIFIGDFLLKGTQLDTNRFVVTSQKSIISADDNKERDIPDLFIYRNNEDYKNNKAFIICEHKIDDKAGFKSSYEKTFSTVKHLILITPNRPYYKNNLHLYWEELFYLLNKNFFGSNFYNYSSYENYLQKTNTKFDSEHALIFNFLDFMDWVGINTFDTSYFRSNYSNFENFCSKVRQALEIFNSYKDKLKKEYGAGGKGIELMTFIENCTIKTTRNNITYGIYLDDDNNLIEYKFYNKTNEEKRVSHKSKFNSKDFSNSNRILNDIFQLFKIVLLDISNELTHIDIYEDTIKLVLESNKLKMNYNISKKKPNYNHEFDVSINRNKIIIDYDAKKDKIIYLREFDFELLYDKLKKFIGGEKTQ